MLICVSELQRVADRRVNEICVPHQVGMFQSYLARLSGLYYLDPPFGYMRAPFAQEGFAFHLPVKGLDRFFSSDLKSVMVRLDKSPV